MLLKPGLPGLTSRQGIAVEERPQPGLNELASQRLRDGAVGPRIAQENVIDARGLPHGPKPSEYTPIVKLAVALINGRLVFGIEFERPFHPAASMLAPRA